MVVAGRVGQPTPLLTLPDIAMSGGIIQSLYPYLVNRQRRGCLGSLLWIMEGRCYDPPYLTLREVARAEIRVF